MWKQLGVHLGTRSTEGVASVVEVLYEFIYVSFLKSLEQILQIDDIRARVYAQML